MIKETDGRHFSSGRPEVREKIRAALSTPEMKAKISAFHKGKRRSPEAREKMSLNKVGSRNPNWKGGIAIHCGGYVYWLKPNHPYANAKGYVFAHRIIAETCIERILRPDEVVHHINGDKLDNRIENLAIMSNSEHVNLHNKTRMIKQPHSKNGQYISAALPGQEAK